MTQNIFDIDFLDELHFEVRRLPLEIACDLVDFFLGGGQHFSFLAGDGRCKLRALVALERPFAIERELVDLGGAPDPELAETVASARRFSLREQGEPDSHHADAQFRCRWHYGLG